MHNYFKARQHSIHIYFDSKCPLKPSSRFSLRFHQHSTKIKASSVGSIMRNPCLNLNSVKLRVKMQRTWSLLSRFPEGFFFKPAYLTSVPYVCISHLFVFTPASYRAHQPRPAVLQSIGCFSSNALIFSLVPSSLCSAWWSAQLASLLFKRELRQVFLP